MIIEGRHSEVGNGIFISDIQEGSVAEQVNDRANDCLASHLHNGPFLTERLLFLFVCLFFNRHRQAGLTVGDMILCVNKDELLGADYETVGRSITEFFFLNYFCIFQSFLNRVFLNRRLSGGLGAEEIRGPAQHRRLQSGQIRRRFRRRFRRRQGGADQKGREAE